MAAITAAMVKELREMTGAGMMDCKKALNECDGNMEAAVDFLKKSGAAKMEKKASRIAAEGIARVAVNGNEAVVAEVNSETDFVAKNEKFRGYVAAVAAQAAKTNAADIDAFVAEPWDLDNSKTVAEELASQIAVIGENMNIRRFAKIVAENGFVESYIHGAGRIGILVEMEASEYSEAARECAKNVAMQIAAMNTKYVNQTEIPADYIEHEKEILKAQIMNDPKESQKPEKVIDGMINGRINKQLKEICLVDQVYVKDGELTVQKYIDSVAKENGITLAVKKFVRFETGEGIEKKEENFAEEVAKQMGM